MKKDTNKDTNKNLNDCFFKKSIYDKDNIEIYKYDSIKKIMILIYKKK
jgi:hypothetical protein